MFRLNKNKNSGFTLIELMVVISVISFMASLIIVSTVNARKKAKIARAKADLYQIRVGMYNLQIDTGKGPNGCYNIEAHDSAETELDSPWAGLMYLDSGALVNGGFDKATGASQANHVHNGVNTSYYAQYHSDSNQFLCGWVASDLAKWRGPYVDHVRDPWGRAYFYDPDYWDYSINQSRPAILSFGVDGVHDPIAHTALVDDVVLFLGYYRPNP